MQPGSANGRAAVWPPRGRTPGSSQAGGGEEPAACSEYDSDPEVPRDPQVALQEPRGHVLRKRCSPTRGRPASVPSGPEYVLETEGVRQGPPCGRGTGLAFHATAALFRGFPQLSRHTTEPHSLPERGARKVNTHVLSPSLGSSSPVTCAPRH